VTTEAVADRLWVVTFSSSRPLPDGLRRSFDAARRFPPLPAHPKLTYAPFPKKGAEHVDGSREPIPRRRSPGYAARQNMQVENTMKPLPRYSPLIQPLAGHPSAWHFFTGHPVAILVLAAWALQLAHFAFVIVRWRLGRSSARLRSVDAARYFAGPANDEGWSATTLPR
jgi:hypothetical protein